MRNAGASWFILDQPDTFLAPGARTAAVAGAGAGAEGAPYRLAVAAAARGEQLAAAARGPGRGAGSTQQDPPTSIHQPGSTHRGAGALAGPGPGAAAGEQARRGARGGGGGGRRPAGRDPEEVPIGVVRPRRAGLARAVQALRPRRLGGAGV